MLVQAVEVFSMLYENSYPMRFGVILLSGRVLEQIAASGEDILTSVGADDVSNLKDSETDLSLLVYPSINLVPLPSSFLVDSQAYLEHQWFSVFFL